MLLAGLPSTGTELPRLSLVSLGCRYVLQLCASPHPGRRLSSLW